MMQVATSPLAKSAKQTRLTGRQVGTVVVVVGILIAPMIDHSYRFLSLAISVGIATITLYGLAILFGQCGLFSMGQASLMGVGAYTAAKLAATIGLGFWPSIPFAMVAAAIVAGLLGVFSIRVVSAQYFIIVTFAFGALFSIIMNNGGTFTGGAQGLDVGPISPILGVKLSDIHHFYYLTVVFVLLSIIVTYAISKSRYGRTLRAIRENESLARSVAINSGFHKIVVFMLSGALAGLAGTLQTYYLQHISPSLFETFPSVYLALMVMIGGPRMLYGPLAGAIIVYFLPEVLHLDPIDARIAYGAALIVVILVLPRGILGGIIDLYRWVISTGRHSRAASQEVK